MQVPLPAPRRHPVDSPAAWVADSFRHDHSWLHELTPSQRQSLQRLGDQLSAQETTNFSALDDLRQEALELAPLMKMVSEQLKTLGFALIRGVPVDHISQEAASRLFWVIGSFLGTGLTQNAQAQLLCPVTDMGVRFQYDQQSHQANARGYQSRADLNYHCDPTDVVGLLCVRKAMSGGASTIVSSTTIYNRIATEAPELLEVLEAGFAYDRKGEQQSHEAPVSAPIPVFVNHGDYISCRYARSYIQGGALKSGRELSQQQINALDRIDQIAREPGVAFKIDFEPGDIQLLNNFTVLHGRESYEDHEDVSQRRFLYRLWLHMGEQMPWSREDDVMRWEFVRFGKLGLTSQEL